VCTCGRSGRRAHASVRLSPASKNSATISPCPAAATGSGSAYQAAPRLLCEGMKVRKGVRRGLVATVMALLVAFMSTGCEPPHIKAPDVPAEVHDFNNIRKHASNEKDLNTCYDDQGIPYSDDC
jgi:hypothetical protein